MYGCTITRELIPPLLPPLTYKKETKGMDNSKPTQLDFSLIDAPISNSSPISSNDEIDKPLIDFSSPEDSPSSLWVDSQSSYSTKSHSTRNSTQSNNSNASYGLTDLLENMLVTAADVQQNTPFKIDYEDFFNKYEANNRNELISLATNNNVAINEDKANTTLHNNDKHSLPHTVDDIIPITNDNEISKACDAIEDHEKLLDDIIFTKTIIDKGHLASKKLRYAVQKVKMNTQNLSTTQNTPNISLNYNNVITSVACNSKSTNQIEIFNPLRYYNLDRFFIASQNPADDGRLFRILAIEKNSKKYARNRIITSDQDKLWYSRGPTLEEKIIVLPQIMRRLALKKKSMGTDMDSKKLYVLDSGTSKLTGNMVNTNGTVQLNPEILMADCNMERLKALKTRQMFDSFVRTGNII